MGYGKYAGPPNHSLRTWVRRSEWLRLTYLADSPCRWAHIVTLAFDHVVGTARKVLLNTLYAGTSQACYKLRCIRVNPHEKRSEVPGRIPNRSSGMRSVGRSRSLRGSSESYDSLRKCIARQQWRQ